MHTIADVYGKLLFDMLLQDIGEKALFENQEIFLVPIPLSRSRMRERGYNQSELLVNAILRADTSRALQNGSRFLRRKDTTLRQSHTKEKRDRLKNIINSFVVNEKISRRAHFILIDDVVTTGATLREARKTLRTAGARKIHAYIIAY